MWWRPASFATAAPSSSAGGCCADDSILPFVVALQNSAEGIYADAVLHRVADIHGLFSSALANFHVTTRLYYQTCVFLYSLMPRRPLGHHYSTIGYNHVGKVAILNEIVEQMRTQRPAVPALARARRERWRSASPSMPAPTI